MTPPGIDPGTVRLVAQRSALTSTLPQAPILYYIILHYIILYYIILYYIILYYNVIWHIFECACVGLSYNKELWTSNLQ